MDIITILVISLFVLLLALVHARGRIKKLKHQLLNERELDEISHARAIADGFYDNVLEADLIHNTLVGMNCRKLTELLKLPQDVSFSDCIETIAEKMVKEEYRELYREKFNIYRLLERYDRGELKFSFEFEERTDFVHYYWTHVTGCIYYSEANHTVKLISYVKNIQEEKERELLLQKEAATDYLTGLYNKRAIERSISDILRSNNSTFHCHALIIVDIDNFKTVNDTIGHLGGDRVLCTIARLLKQLSDETDLIGRIGGDEFMIFIRNCSGAEAVKNRMKKLVEAAASPDMKARLDTEISLSLGGALYPEQADNFPDLFASADAALYHVKTHGRNGGRLFQSEVHTA